MDRRASGGAAGTRRKWDGCGCTGEGLDEVWGAVLKHREELECSGGLAAHRLEQQRDWMWNMVRDELIESLRTSPQIRQAAAEIDARLATESLSALEGAESLLRSFAQAVPSFHWAKTP